MSTWIKTDWNDLIRVSGINRIYYDESKRDGLYSSSLMPFKYTQFVCTWYEFYISPSIFAREESNRMLKFQVPVALGNVIMDKFILKLYEEIASSKNAIIPMRALAQDILIELSNEVDLVSIMEEEKFYCEEYSGL